MAKYSSCSINPKNSRDSSQFLVEPRAEDVYELIGRFVCRRQDGTFATSLDQLGVSEDFRRLVESSRRI